VQETIAAFGRMIAALRADADAIWRAARTAAKSREGAEWVQDEEAGRACAATGAHAMITPGPADRGSLPPASKDRGRTAPGETMAPAAGPVGRARHASYGSDPRKAGYTIFTGSALRPGITSGRVVLFRGAVDHTCDSSTYTAIFLHLPRHAQVGPPSCYFSRWTRSPRRFSALRLSERRARTARKNERQNHSEHRGKVLCPSYDAAARHVRGGLMGNAFGGGVFRRPRKRTCH